MRIVHEVLGRFETGGGCEAYRPARGQRKGRGFHVELLLVPRRPRPRLQPEEEIYIEGHAAYVLDMLRSAVSMIEEVGEGFVRDGKIVPGWQKLHGDCAGTAFRQR